MISAFCLLFTGAGSYADKTINQGCTMRLVWEGKEILFEGVDHSDHLLPKPTHSEPTVSSCCTRGRPCQRPVLFCQDDQADSATSINFIKLQETPRQQRPL